MDLGIMASLAYMCANEAMMMFSSNSIIAVPTELPIISSVSTAQLESAIAAGLVAAAAASGGSTLKNDIQELKDDLKNEKNDVGEISAGDKTQRGREYTRHAAERANERGFDSKTIDSIIDNNYKNRVKEIDSLTGEVTWRYQDGRGNTVITNEWGDKIVTVYSYPESANGGHYIPKG